MCAGPEGQGAGGSKKGGGQEGGFWTFFSPIHTFNYEIDLQAKKGA